MVERACQALGSDLEAIYVFEEKHKDGASHFHALVELRERSRSIWKLDPMMDDMHKAKTYTQIVVGAGSKAPKNRILRYCVVPTPGKTYVDPSPYLSRHATIPPTLANEGARAAECLASRPANADEVQ